MRKFMICFLIALATIVLITALIMLSDPLRRSQKHIRKDILKLTPIGTSMDDVIMVIAENQKWKVRYISDEFGYSRPGPSDPVDAALGRRTIVGEKSIRVFIGEYRNIFITSVTVFWGFDEDSKLIEVYVWKDTDTF